MNIRPRRSLLNPELQRPSALKSIPRNPEQLWLDKNENLDPELMAFTQRAFLHTAGSRGNVSRSGRSVQEARRWWSE